MRSSRVILAGLVLFTLALMGLYGCDSGAAPAPTAVTSNGTPGSTNPTPGSTNPTPGGNTGSGGMGGWKVTPTSGSASGIKMTVNSIRTETEGILSADAGHEYVVLNLTFDNSTSEEAVISSVLLFTMTDDTGKEYNITVTANLKPQLEAVNDAKAPAGGSLTGEVAYEIPTTVKKLTFVYKPILQEDTVTFNLER